MKRLTVIATGLLIASCAITIPSNVMLADDLVQVCSAKYPPGFVEAMSKAGPDTGRGLDSGFHPELTVVKKYVWPSGTDLHVRFIGGDPAVHKKVETAAKGWMRETTGNFRFLFDDSPNAQIRVNFDRSSGSWSWIGSSAETLKPHEPTMNFGWLTPETPDAEYDRVVLHEFGHALGAAHEHANPDVTIEWKKKVVIAHYKATNKWTKAMVERNIFFKYPKEAVVNSKFDPESIMLYAFPGKFTENNMETSWNRKLSQIDKDMIRALYP